MRLALSSLGFACVCALGCGHAGDAVIGRSTGPTVTTTRMEFEDEDPAALTLFDAELAPYGAWTSDEVAGTVWIPNPNEAGNNFVPYASHGHFAYAGTQAAQGKAADWIWVSDVAWGWVTSHYGRWTYVAKRSSWAWVPGRRYAGAWVTFRVGTNCGQAGTSTEECIVGWGPKAPHIAWRGEEAVRRPAKTALFVYAHAKDLFDNELSSRLLVGDELMKAAGKSPVVTDAPLARDLGLAMAPPPPTYDAGLRKALLLATPDSANAMGVAPSLGRYQFSSYVTGGPKFIAPPQR